MDADDPVGDRALARDVRSRWSWGDCRARSGNFNQTLGGGVAADRVGRRCCSVYAGTWRRCCRSWTLLQPRDYINSLQLVSAMGAAGAWAWWWPAIFGGAPAAPAGGGRGSARQPLEIVAPMVRDEGPAGAAACCSRSCSSPIACGAISGFHCLVSSAERQQQAADRASLMRPVPWGTAGCCTEGFLAVLVIVACVARGSAWARPTARGGVVAALRQRGIRPVTGLGAKVSRFRRMDRLKLLARPLGMGAGTAVALMGVLVASFAGTTLDTATRLQRYVDPRARPDLRRRQDAGERQFAGRPNRVRRPPPVRKAAWRGSGTAYACSRRAVAPSPSTASPAPWRRRHARSAGGDVDVGQTAGKPAG